VDAQPAPYGSTDKAAKGATIPGNNEGPPVHRIVHEKRGSVHAYKWELNDWWERRETLVEAEEPPPVNAGLPAEPGRRFSWRTLVWGGDQARLVASHSETKDTTRQVILLPLE